MKRSFSYPYLKLVRNFNRKSTQLKTTRFAAFFVLNALFLILTSCVNEWPKLEDREYPVVLKVNTVTEWLLESEFYFDDISGAEIQYLFQMYSHQDPMTPVKEFSYYTSNTNYPELTFPLDLPPGKYDLYAWVDLCESSSKESLFYNVDSFSEIAVKLPYKGDTNQKDAFCGHTEFEIKPSMELQPSMEVVLILTRPLARYEIIATDLKEFIEQTIKEKATKSDDNTINIENYSVKLYYTGYFPAIFDVFRENPIDSYTDISFEGGVKVVSDSEALLAFDFAFVNGMESSVPVAFEIFDPEGVRISFVKSLNIPTQRNFNTVVKGNFLTTLEEGGIDINNEFDGQFNIEYKYTLK